MKTRSQRGRDDEESASLKLELSSNNAAVLEAQLGNAVCYRCHKGPPPKCKCKWCVRCGRPAKYSVSRTRVCENKECYNAIARSK